MTCVSIYSYVVWGAKGSVSLSDITVANATLINVTLSEFSQRLSKFVASSEVILQYVCVRQGCLSLERGTSARFRYPLRDRAVRSSQPVRHRCVGESLLLECPRPRG